MGLLSWAEKGFGGAIGWGQKTSATDASCRAHEHNFDLNQTSTW
jgi:hypothetical protein